MICVAIMNVLITRRRLTEVLLWVKEVVYNVIENPADFPKKTTLKKCEEIFRWKQSFQRRKLIFDCIDHSGCSFAATCPFC